MRVFQQRVVRNDSSVSGDSDPPGFTELTSESYSEVIYVRYSQPY